MGTNYIYGGFLLLLGVGIQEALGAPAAGASSTSTSTSTSTLNGNGGQGHAQFHQQHQYGFGHGPHYQPPASVFNGNYLGDAASTPVPFLPSMSAAAANMQYMAMNHDGQYSFGYAGHDSSREETRGHDGSVHGKYSYTNPEGKTVHVQYSADALNGFNTIEGQNGVSAPVTNVHTVVQDTPAVQEARQRFFATYARELARVKAGTPAGSATLLTVTSPVSVEHSVTSTTSHSSKSPSPATATATHSHVVTTSARDPGPAPAAQAPAPAAEPPISSQVTSTSTHASTGTGTGTSSGSAMYSVAGFDSNRFGGLGGYAFQQQHQQYQQPGVQVQYGDRGVQHNGNGPNAGPAYFYYVGVGGHPYYVQAPPVRNTNIAVSVRASQHGAIPADAVHDAQTPRFGPHAVRSKAPTPPVYVEIGKDYTLPSSAPGAGVGQYSQAPPQPQQAAYQHTSSLSGVGVSTSSGHGHGGGAKEHSPPVHVVTGSVSGISGGASSAGGVGFGGGYNYNYNHNGLYQVPYFRLPYYGYQPTFIY